MKYQLITPRIPLTKEYTAVERVLINRGIQPQDLYHYLNTTDNDNLNPHLIANIEEGAKLLVKHLACGDSIFVQVDSDADGLTSAAILINYLNDLFPGLVQNNISYRLHDGKQHGIILDTIPVGTKLVICPDSASNDYEAHAALAAQGIDVLVIDHHEADYISENAVIINNQLCDYPTKTLSGVGMVYKFCQYLDEIAEEPGHADKFLDLVALGMVADMMKLTDFETKHLIQKGLNNLQNDFMKALVIKNEFSLKGELSPIGVAFYLAPYVNATIRSGTQEEKYLLFESMLSYRANELIPSTKRGCKGQMETRVEQAVRNCCNIKSRQTKARDAQLDMIESIIAEKDLLKNKVLAVKLPKEKSADPNLTGLIANVLMAKYQRPVMILNEVIEETMSNEGEVIQKQKYWRGSARGYDKSELLDFREFVLASGLSEYSQGHSNAFGQSFKDEDFEPFIKYANEALADIDFEPCYRVDAIYQGADFKSKDILELAAARSLWGQGVEEPFIAIEHINVYAGNVKLLSKDKNPTLKITLNNGVDLMKFKSSIEEFDKFNSATGCITITIVGKCSINEWCGNITPQILIEDYEITDEQLYYF